MCQRWLGKVGEHVLKVAEDYGVVGRILKQENYTQIFVTVLYSCKALSKHYYKIMLPRKS